MYDKLISIETHYHELTDKLSDPTIIKDSGLFQKYAKERSDLEELMTVFAQYKLIFKQIQDNDALILEGGEFGKMAEEENHDLKRTAASLEEEMKQLLIPKDPYDGKNILLEIRAGTGGDEAGLFAGDMFRMYSKYAEKNKWKIEILEMSQSGIGSIREVIALVQGKNVYGKLKFEAGVHRVQRVPATETQGRIHTSTVTVAVLPEADDVDIKIEEKDIRVDVYRSGGHGGQSVNTTDSAVRITYLPTGMMVAIQDEKSQHKNKAKAMKILKSRLLEIELKKRELALSQTRKSMIGSGDRSERIRTYNYPQGRITDHRIGVTIYQLPLFLEGEIDDMINALVAHHQAELLKSEIDLSAHSK